MSFPPQIIYAGVGNTQIVIKTIKSLDNAARAEIIDTLGEDFGITQEDVLASEQFGPSVGDELKANALKAVIIASIGMLIYIIFRFKSWKYGVTAIAGVVHDVLMGHRILCDLRLYGQQSVYRGDSDSGRIFHQRYDCHLRPYPGEQGFASRRTTTKPIST